MAKAQFVRGVRAQIHHISTAAIEVDEIIPIDNNITVAFQAAEAAGEEILASATGEFIFPAASASTILAGERIMWDSSASEVVDNGATPAAGDIMGFGIAVKGKPSGQTTCHGMLTPGAGVRS